MFFISAKAFLSYLSQALSVEYSSCGITIQTVICGQVSTKLAANYKLPVFVPTAKEYVQECIKTVGIEFVTNGHWKHKLFCFMMDHFVVPIFGTRITMFFMLIVLKKYRDIYFKNKHKNLKIQQV